MKRISIISALLLCCILLTAQEWRYAGHGTRTVWTEDLKYPDRVQWEYPRPQMLRSRWCSLNGLWSYVVTPAEQDSMPPTSRIIYVPFPLEAPLSGAGRTVLERDALWYSRTFEVPEDWKGERVILHFGGVESWCEVYVNGKVAGTHSGAGAFQLDITEFLFRKGEQNLVLKVRDGKASEPGPVTGIWQSVWLEPVSAKARVDSCSTGVDLERGILSITPYCSGVKGSDKLRIYVFDDDKIIADCIINPGETAAVKLQDPKIWTPSEPHLYDFTVNVFRGSRLLDVVRCYTAFRTVGPGMLNGAAFVPSAEIKGRWWSDGLCNAPCDAALRSEIEEVRTLGPNALYRPWAMTPRAQFWCDVLGVMIMPE